jgi:tetratricopeptide (TPR) repeat protein
MQLLPFLIATSLVLGPATGAAAPANGEGASTGTQQPPQEAVDAFMNGRKLYAEGRWEEALASFLEADKLFPAPDLQYNIGLCHERLEHWDEAIQAFEIYLRTKPSAADREAVEGRIARAKLKREEEQNPPPATDGNEPTNNATKTDPTDRTEPPTDDAKPSTPFIAAGSVLLALGVAGAFGGALGIGFAVQRKNDELDEILEGGNPSQVRYDEAKDIERDAKRLVTFQYVAAGIGAAVAVTGAVLLGIGLKRRADAKKGKVSLVPGVGPRSAGFVLQGKF